MQCSRALGGLMYSGALLLPFAAAADSQLQSGTHGPLGASAQVRFRIIIPTVLSLDVFDGARAADAQRVAIMSNSRNVSLGATLGASAESKGRVILNAAARRIIAQNAPCMLEAPQSAAADPGATNTKRVVCTVSMP